MKTIVTKAIFFLVFVIFCSPDKVFSQPHTSSEIPGGDNLPGEFYTPDEAYGYIDNEFIILYKEDATESIKNALRSRYNVTIFKPIGDQLELWQFLSFPMVVQDDTDDNTYVTLANVEELKVHIDVQSNGTEVASDERAGVNGGDYNYLFQLPSSSFNTQMLNQFDPTPGCLTDDHRIFGQNGSFAQNPITIIIIDQVISQTAHFSNSNIEVVDYSWFTALQAPLNVQNTSTNHAEQIGGLIQEILTKNGIPSNFLNIGVFNSSGKATYATLLKAFYHLDTSNVDNALINLSANMIVDDQLFGQAIWDKINILLTEKNLLMMSSAGNQGLQNETVFPGSANLSHEITIAGTENCYSDIWSQSNTDPIHFELLAEATNISTPTSGNEYELVSGTSFSTAMVTAVAAQIATHFENFDALLIKNQLLSSADQNMEMTWAVEQGRVLNATSATATIQAQQLGDALELQVAGNNSIPSKSLTVTELQITPNPFSEHPQITLPDLADQSNGYLQLFNAQGQLIWSREIPAYEYSYNLTPNWGDFSSGIYFLQWRTQQSSQVLKLIKR